MSKNEKYSSLLRSQLERYKKETKFLEFKSNYQEPEKLGRYISALSNGACLDHQDYAYLYFGIDDATLEVKGTTFDISRVNAKGNQALELYLRQCVAPKINFTIEEFFFDGQLRVVRFRIPAAAGQPTTFINRPYVRVDSHTTDLSPYTDWLRTIYTSQDDWTAHVIEDATVEDLDQEAVAKAKEDFKERFPDYRAEVDKWDDVTFLDKANMTQEGQVTNAAMLRKKHLIEGRRPHVFIAKAVAQKTNRKIEYSKHKGLVDKSCEALLKEAFHDHGNLTRKEIDDLLLNILPDQLSEVQRKNKIYNILRKMSKRGIITVSGKGPRGVWSWI